MADASRSQRENYIHLYDGVENNFGKEAADAISGAAMRWGKQNDKDYREVYDYAIHLAEQKLNAPVISLGWEEYEEIIKAKDVMDAM